MFWRTTVRVLAVVLLVAIVVGIGAAIYNQGVTAGLTDAARQAAETGEPIPLDRYGYAHGGPYFHGPFGIGLGVVFGIFFWIFAIFLIMGLLRAAFGGGHGPRGSGGGGWTSRREKLEEWHREFHRRENGEGSQRPLGA